MSRRVRSGKISLFVKSKGEYRESEMWFLSVGNADWFQFTDSRFLKIYNQIIRLKVKTILWVWPTASCLNGQLGMSHVEEEAKRSERNSEQTMGTWNWLEANGLDVHWVFERVWLLQAIRNPRSVSPLLLKSISSPGSPEQPWRGARRKLRKPSTP